MLRIAFRADGGADLGMGHLARCRSLMRELADRGPCVFTVLTANPGVAGAFFHSSGLPVATRRPEEGIDCDVVVADRPGLASGEREALRGRCRTLVIVDDAWTENPPCDLRVIPNLLALARDNTPPGSSRIPTLAGGDHLILDPGFAREAAAAARTPRMGQGYLLACFGGSDPKGLMVGLWPLLEEFSERLPVRLVIGPANPRAAEIKSKAEDRKGISAVLSPPDLFSEYRGALAALLSGGTQMYEACCLGLPAVIVSQNEEQARESALAAASGAVLETGPGGPLDPARIAASLRSLLDDPGRRLAVSEAGRKLVDPSGTRRVVDRLLSLHAGKIGEGRT